MDKISKYELLRSAYLVAVVLFSFVIGVVVGIDSQKNSCNSISNFELTVDNARHAVDRCSSIMAADKLADVTVELIKNIDVRNGD